MNFMKEVNNSYSRFGAIIDVVLWFGLAFTAAMYWVGLNAINNDQVTLFASEHLCYDKDLDLTPQ